MSEIIIPKHLESTYKMLKKAFPDGIRDIEYFPLISLLYEHMSDRNLAEVISLVTEKDNVITLNDIHKSESTNQSSDEEMDLVKEKLLPYGFEEWINED